MKLLRIIIIIIIVAGDYKRPIKCMNQMEANNHTACHMCVCWNLFECDKCINAWKEKDSAWRSWFTIECDPFIKWYKIQFSFSINILIKFNHDLLYSLCEMPMVATEFPSFPFPLMCNELHQFQTIETTRTDHWLSFLIVHDARLYTLAKKKKKNKLPSQLCLQLSEQ